LKLISVVFFHENSKVLARHNSLESNCDANHNSGRNVGLHFSPLSDDLECNKSFLLLDQAQLSQGPLDEVLLASNRHMQVADCNDIALSYLHVSSFFTCPGSTRLDSDRN
jgi:nucleoside-specific outer membrane channel protein Tsx